jgi:hypothetical protein
MSAGHPPKPVELHRGSEVVRLLTEIRALTVELAELQRKPAGEQRLERTERAIERLRWQLAGAARRAATDELGNAA